MESKSPRELTEKEYNELYLQEAKRREYLGLLGPPFVRRKQVLCHPQNSDYKKWLENDLEYNANKGG